jgi:aspartyl protease family protein
MTRSPFFWLVIGVFGLTLVLLLLRPTGAGAFDVDSAQVAQALGLVAVLAFVLLGVTGRGTFGRAARNALAWGLVLVVILIGYAYWDEISLIAQRVAGEISPGTPVTQTDGKTGEVVITRGRGGHFVVNATLNYAPIEMMVDTGASVITLTPEDARFAGIQTRLLNYNVPVQTANGTTLAAAVVIDRLTIGSIERRRISALVAQPGMLDQSLLGNNFLNSLQSFTVSGRQMILTP